MKTKHIVTGILLSLLFLSARGQDANFSILEWKDHPGDILNQFPGWYDTEEAHAIATNVLLWQRANGGWPENKDMINVSAADKKTIRKNRKAEDTNFDNGATYTQLRFLAKVYALNNVGKYKKAFLEGLDYVLQAQYDNGGWPLYYPNFTDYNVDNSDHNPEGYTRFITFNDNAMVGVMDLLYDIAHQHEPFAFVDVERREKATQALEKGIACTLKTQLKAEGNLAGWCAQYDENTLEPRWGRHYEPPVLCSHETSRIVQFLMRIENPSPEVVNAIQHATKWMNEVKIRSTMVLESSGEEVESSDEDEAFTWAHYYEMDRSEPVFANDDMMYDTYVAIPDDMRGTHFWYSDLPQQLLTTDYPRWVKQQEAKSVLMR